MLTLVAGIDEVGYGPILGPLVVSSSIFLIKENPESNLWIRLQDSIGKSKKGLGSRILVCDSKKAFSQKSGLKYLEQTVKAFLNQLHLGRTTFSSLLPIIYNNLIAQIRKYPWYQALYDNDIPGIDETISDNLTKNLELEGIEFIDFLCCCIDVMEFNEIVHSTKNKANTVIIQMLKLVQQIISIAVFCAAKKIIIFCDRLGGRKYYEDVLKSLTGFEIVEAEESDKISKYKLTSNKRELTIQFEVGADNNHMPVALASMVGKYIREKVIRGMNEYFVKLQPGLKPTAGYYTDGWRFLKELKHETYEKAGFTIHDVLRIK